MTNAPPWFILELKYNPYTPNERSVCHAYFCISILLTNSYALAVSLLPFTSMGTTNAENKSTFVANVSINLPLLSTLLKTLNLLTPNVLSVGVLPSLGIAMIPIFISNAALKNITILSNCLSLHLIPFWFIATCPAFILSNAFALRLTSFIRRFSFTLTNLSTRAISRFLKASINFSVSHVAVHYWTKAFAPWFHAVSTAFMASLNLASDEWHADETFIKIKGVTYYLWILLDSETRFVISFILSDKRDGTSAYRLFQRAVSLTRASPKVIITDHLAAYEQAIATFYPNAEHYCYKDFTDDKSNNTIEAFNKTFKGWYRTKKGFKAFTSSLGLITTYMFHYNFLRQHSSLNQLPPAIVAGANYSDMRQRQWLLS